jgi:hypothetical protein
MLIGRCLDQLHAYPHLVARTVDRVFQHSANMQFAGNLRDRLVCFAIGEHIDRSISGIPGRGMTDEIITDLAQLAGPKVISRTSAMRYKGSDCSDRCIVLLRWKGIFGSSSAKYRLALRPGRACE